MPNDDLSNRIARSDVLSFFLVGIGKTREVRIAHEARTIMLLPKALKLGMAELLFKIVGVEVTAAGDSQNTTVYNLYTLPR